VGIIGSAIQFMFGEPTACMLFGHPIYHLRHLPLDNADQVRCRRCDRLFVRKLRGEWAGCIIPWSEETEKMYKQFSRLNNNLDKLENIMEDIENDL
jgi:hypothetical protein